MPWFFNLLLFQWIFVWGEGSRGRETENAICVNNRALFFCPYPLGPSALWPWEPCLLRTVPAPAFTASLPPGSPATALDTLQSPSLLPEKETCRLCDLNISQSCPLFFSPVAPSLI